MGQNRFFFTRREWLILMGFHVGKCINVPDSSHGNPVMGEEMLVSEPSYFLRRRKERPQNPKYLSAGWNFQLKQTSCTKP